jgi:hypothetical protein
MSKRRHDGGERGGGSSWLKKPRVAPKAQQLHTIRCVSDAYGQPVWYDYITPGNRIVRIDLLLKDDRPMAVAEYVERLMESGYPVIVEPKKPG